MHHMYQHGIERCELLCVKVAHTDQSLARVFMFQQYSPRHAL